LTFAELIVGLNTATNELMRARRRAHLLRVEGWVEALPFDVICARAWARIYAAVEHIGRKPRGSRAIDLMIAATALAHDLPLYTLNPKDLQGLEGLIEVVDAG
jgi:predicted nucleic acid-binding protein